MNKTPYITLSHRVRSYTFASALLLLVGCAPSAIDTPTPEDKKTTTVEDTSFHISFVHPSSWGDWIVSPNPTMPDSEAIAEKTFSKHGGTNDSNVYFIFRRYDTNDFRYEEVCDTERSVDLCDATMQQDILEQKEQFNKDATQQIGGMPASIKEWYDVPSGYVMRKVQFYTETHRVQMYASYNIIPYLMLRQNEDEDLQTTAKRVFGKDLDSIMNGVEKRKENTTLQSATDFFKNVDVMTKSITLSSSRNTFSSTRYNYTIKYPNDWFVLTEDSESDFTERGENPISMIGGDTVFSNYENPYQYQMENPAPDDMAMLSLMAYKVDANTTLDAFIETHGFVFDTKEAVTIDSYQGLVLRSQASEDQPEIQNTLIKKDDMIYALHFNGLRPSENISQSLKTTYDSIINSLDLK